MNKQFIKDAFGWGFVLWLIGYVLGIAVFPVVPTGVMGWVIMPIGTAIALWVLVKKVKADFPGYYALVALVWTLMAVVLDYFLLVKVFKPENGYYKLDVYLYYAITLILPLIVNLSKKVRKEEKPVNTPAL